MDSLSPQVVSATKLPILNPNEFDLWKIRIDQYFLMTDYSLWEVILNGDSTILTRVIDCFVQPVTPTTAEQRLARKNELKGSRGYSRSSNASSFSMSLTGAVSRWLRNEPSGLITNWETQKTNFLNKYCQHARTTKKMEEINYFQQEPDENLFRAWKRFKELLMKFPQHYLTNMQEVILFYIGLDVPTRQILNSKARSTETSDELAAIQAQLNNLERKIKKVNEKVYVAQTFKEPLTKFMTKSAKRHEENSDIIKEIKASTDAAIRNQGASIKTLKIQIGQMSKVLQERGNGGLCGSTEQNLRDHIKLISTTKADSSEIRRMRYSPYVVSGSQHRSIFSETVPFPRRLQDYCCDDWREAHDVKILEAYDHTLPQKEKDIGSITLPCFIHNVCFDNVTFPHFDVMLTTLAIL
nr:hypothetical protein [Tanacetum cinerariifolium]